MYRIESSSDPIIIIKGNSFLDCNEAALKLFGYQNQKNVFLQLCLQELVIDQHSDKAITAHRILNLLEQVYEEGVWKEVIICKKRNGESFLIDLQLISLMQQNGTGEAVIVSKWKKAKDEHALLSDQNFSGNEAECEKSPIVLNIQQDGKIIYANPPACLFFNYSEAEIVQHLFLHDIIAIPELISEPLYNFPKSFFNLNDLNAGLENPKEVAFLNREKQQIEAWANLTFLWTEKSGADLFQLEILPKERFPKSGSLPEDVNLEIASLRQENKNLKRVQKILKKSMDRLRVLAEYSPDAIMQFNRAHRHLFVNSQVHHFTGFAPEDFLGKTNAEIGFPKEFCEKCDEILDVVFSSGKSNRVELMLPSGIWIDWFLIPEFNCKGEVNTVITTSRDITEQKRIHFKLQESERKLNDAFEVTKLSSWSYNFKTKEIKTNSNFNALIGLNNEGKKNRLPASEFLERFVLKEDHGKIKYVVNAAIASCSEDFQDVVDFRVKTKSGEIVHVLASFRLEVSKEGRVEKAYGTTQDITQLRLTEQELEEYRTSLERLVETRTQELKKSEEKLADALKLANLGTWEYDPIVDCFLVSEEVFEIIGSTSEIEGGNLVGVPRLKEVIHPDDYPVYRQAVLGAQENTAKDYTEHAELRIFRSDGEIRHIYLSIKTSRTGNHIKFFGTLQDITEIRHAEVEKERLNAIIEATTDTVGIIRPDGNILYLNKAGRDFFGFKNEENLLNKTFYHFQPLRISKVLAGKVLKEADKSGAWSGESQYVRHDGVEIPVSQVVVSHKNAQGQVECYSTIIRDISQQKKIEQDLIFKNNELDTFVYRASHDLRGPIATLMGLYNLVQYEVRDEQSLHLFDMYNSQILRLNTIILTLIELTKIKEREFQPSVVNFKKTIRNVFSKLQGMTESKDMLFEQDIEPIENYVSDEHLLFVILQNMVENSIKYKRQDADSFVRVEIKKVKETDRILIKVSDNGIGIDSAIQSKIYNMFFRGNERSSGSGLGLYILKNAVEKLGGKVALYSVLYKGTTFKIELPPLKK